MPSLTCHVPSLSLPPLPRALLPAPRPWRLASTASVPSPSPPATRTLPTPGAVPASQLRASPASGSPPLCLVNSCSLSYLTHGVPCRRLVSVYEAPWARWALT